MAESQKGAPSITDSKKKSPLLEDDNEQDFLDSWKSTAGGKDALDSSAEAVPRERKKVFDLGKLYKCSASVEMELMMHSFPPSDDFELDAEFGKLSSFKMDMSDLDFCSPPKKTEKSKQRLGKEAICGKLEGKKDHFFFSFDFNELDAFDIDTNLLKVEKKPKKCAESDVLDIFEDDIRKSPKLGGTSSSNSKDPVSSKMDLDTKNVSTKAHADLEQCNMLQQDALTLQEKEMATTPGGEDESNHSEDEMDFQVENPLTTASEKPNADFSVQSLDYSPKETIQQFQNAVPSSATVDAYSGEEKHSTSVRLEDYSQPGMKGPDKEYDSKGLTKHCIEDSLSTDKKPEKNQSGQKNVGQSSIIFHESPKMRKDVGDNSVGPVSNETLPGKRSNGNKQRLSSKVLESSPHRYSKSEQFIAMKENRGLKLLSLNKSQTTGSSATTPKQLYASCKKKMETMNSRPANEKSEHSGGHEQVGNHNSGVFKSFHRTLKVASISAESDTNRGDSNTSCGIRRLVLGTEPTNIIKVASIENRGISLPDAVKSCGLSNMNISRNTKSNKYLSSSVMKETKPVDHSKENMVQHPKASPLSAHSVIPEKNAALSSPLKRKAIEESHMDLLTSNSSKRILESPGERRKALQISPRIQGQGLGSETIGGLYGDIFLDHPNSPLDVCVDDNAMGLEVPVSIENDGNIEKAEACAKELENICNMLKKKHEEAKELLVRALVNNNSLLMLDHPIHEEKILALQRFAAALLLKKYDT